MLFVLQKLCKNSCNVQAKFELAASVLKTLAALKICRSEF